MQLQHIYVTFIIYRFSFDIVSSAMIDGNNGRATIQNIYQPKSPRPDWQHPMAFYTSIGKRLYSKLDLWILKFQYIFNMNMSEFFFKTENLNENICMSRGIIPHGRVWNSNTISHNISDVTLSSYNYTKPTSRYRWYPAKRAQSAMLTISVCQT